MRAPGTTCLSPPPTRGQPGGNGYMRQNLALIKFRITPSEETQHAGSVIVAVKLNTHMSLLVQGFVLKCFVSLVQQFIKLLSSLMRISERSKHPHHSRTRWKEAVHLPWQHSTKKNANVERHLFLTSTKKILNDKKTELLQGRGQENKFIAEKKERE